MLLWWWLCCVGSGGSGDGSIFVLVVGCGRGSVACWCIAVLCDMVATVGCCGGAVVAMLCLWLCYVGSGGGGGGGSVAMFAIGCSHGSISYGYSFV